MKENKDLVEMYLDIYDGKIRPVDEKWVQSQASKYSGCPGYMQREVIKSKKIFNSYSPEKTEDSKRTYVLWKLNSLCACMQKYGYPLCPYGKCTKCAAYINANKQLEEIDNGTDIPTGGNKQIVNDSNRATVYVKGHKIEIWIDN